MAKPKSEATLWIERDLTNHSPSPATQEAMEEVRRAYHSAARKMLAVVPEGRERSLAKTHFEQSLMYAIAALARHGHDVAVALPPAGRGGGRARVAKKAVAKRSPVKKAAARRTTTSKAA